MQQNTSDVFMEILDLKNKLALDLSFDKVLDILLSPFQVVVQDFIEIRQPKHLLNFVSFR